MAEQVGSAGFTGPLAFTALEVAAATRGDRIAFAAIYDRYGPQLFAYCLRTLNGDRDAAADCIQETFYTAATHLHELREPDKLRPWLYKIAHNQALRHVRSRSRERPVDLVPETPSADAGPEDAAARRELATLIDDACDGLSERDRALFELHFRHGLNGPEVAATLDISHTDANTRVGRLRVTMERSLNALLVARQARAHPGRCAELDTELRDWNGRMTAKLRKRLARHLDQCASCDATRKELASLQTLLASVPAAIPAPFWLRDHVLAHATPHLHTATAGAAGGGSGTAGSAGSPHGPSWWPTSKTGGLHHAAHGLHGAHLAWAAPLVAAAVAVPLIVGAVVTGEPVTVAATTPPDAVAPPPATMPRFGLDTSSTPTAPSTSSRPPSIQTPPGGAPPAAPKPGTPGLPNRPIPIDPRQTPYDPGRPGAPLPQHPDHRGSPGNPASTTPDSRSAATTAPSKPTGTPPSGSNGSSGTGG